MGRAIGAAVVGYIVMAIIVFGGLTLVWVLFGPGGAFEPASWTTSLKWDLASLVVSVVAAVAGGYACGLISPGKRSVGILIGIVIVLGALSAVAAFMKGEPAGPRPESIAMFDAMSNARPPLWTAIVNPIIGVVGAAFGSRLRGGPAA